jgi:lipid II:glycine glycyltransferase (peptidoglycan interpeptide bridge formation enzyme)
MSLWQTPSWQDMLVASGQSEEYFVIEQDIENTQLAPVFVEKRRVSLGEYGLFVIGLEREYDQNLQESLSSLCQEENCLFLQVETINYNKQDTTQKIRKYYKKFIPPHTAVIDLTRSSDDILAAMKQKGRYNIRLATKKGVVVEQVEKNPYSVDIFYKLMSETTSRDNFAGNTREYYEIFLGSLDESQLFFAYFEGQVIAAGIFVFTSEIAFYYYGASANSQRNLMAPYLLQWTAIEHAKKRDCQIYDFLGVASPGETNSPLSGVTDFKLKLTPDIREVSDN